MLGIYCRISKDRKNQVSIETQQAHGIEFAKQNGIEFDVYIDKGISGRGKSDKRPEYTRLINDLKSGRITEVYIYERSRSDRDIATWVEFAEIVKSNKVPLYIKGKKKDLTDLDTYYQLVQYAIYDQKYADETAEKIQDALVTNAKNGKAFAVNPYGYKTGEDGKLEVDEYEAGIIKRIHKESLSGKGVDSIAEDLNADDVPTRKGGRWAGKTVNGVIENTIYKGLRFWRGNYYPAPAIVTPEEWQKVYDNFKTKNQKQGRRTEHKVLLQGLVKCGKCGLGYYGRTRKPNKNGYRKDHYYMCVSKRKGYQKCGNRSINIDVLDDIVWWQFDEGILLDAVIKHFEQSDNKAKIDELTAQIERKQKTIKQIETGIQSLYDNVAEGRLDINRLTEAVQKANDKKDIVISELKRLESDLLMYSQVSSKNEILDELKAWRDTKKKDDKKPSYDEWREVFEKFIDRVVVYYFEDRYYIEITSKIPDVETAVVEVDRRYLVAHHLKQEYSYYLKDAKEYKDVPKYPTDKERHKLYNDYLEFKKTVQLPT